MFWSGSLPLSELDLTKENKLLFYSRSILPRYQHLHRETALTWLLSLHVVQLVHRGKGYAHKAEKCQHAEVLHESTQCGVPPWPTRRRLQAVLAARAGQGSQSKEVEVVQTEAGTNVSFSHASTNKKLWALCSKPFPLLQHRWLLPCHRVPCLQRWGREAGRGDFLTLLEPF